MKYKRIVPCLDICGGRVVKGVNFEGLRDAGDPVETAQRYVEAGADEIVFLDITSTIEERKTTIDLVKKIAEGIPIPFIVGGGIRSVEDAARVLDAGATKVSIATAAFTNPKLIEEIAAKFGSKRLVVAIDAHMEQRGNDYDVVICGGKEETGVSAVKWAMQVERLGAGEILLTSMDRDGVMSGYDLELTKAICEHLFIPVIASGGAGKLSDFYDVLVDAGANAALAASLFHFKGVEIGEVKRYLHARGVAVKL